MNNRIWGIILAVVIALIIPLLFLGWFFGLWIFPGMLSMAFGHSMTALLIGAIGWTVLCAAVPISGWVYAGYLIYNGDDMKSDIKTDAK